MSLETIVLIWRIIAVWLAGVAVLLVAILFNSVAIKLNRETWYSLLAKANQTSIFEAVRKSNSIDLLLLVVIYPLLLAITAKICLEVLNMLV